MSNKIEEGCLAIIVNAAHKETFEANVGKIVKVGKFIGKTDPLYEKDDIWEVDKPILVVTALTSSDVVIEREYVYNNSESYMQRIDDNNSANEKETHINVKLTEKV